MRLLQFRSREKWQVLIHEDEEANRDRNVDCCDPSADFKLLLRKISSFVFLQFIELNIGRKLKRAEANRHRMAESHYATHHRPTHPFVFLGKSLQRFAVG